MLGDPFADETLGSVIARSSKNDLKVLSDCLNEPLILKDQEEFPTTSHLIYSFKSVFCREREGFSPDVAYKVILEELSRKLDLSLGNSVVMELEAAVTIFLFSLADSAPSEEVLLDVLRKVLKFKPDGMAENLLASLRGGYGSALIRFPIMLVSLGVSELCKKLQKVTSVDLSLMAFVAKVHFVRKRLL